MEANFGEVPFVFDFEGVLAVSLACMMAPVNIADVSKFISLVPLGYATASSSLYRDLLSQRRTRGVAGKHTQVRGKLPNSYACQI